MLEKKLNKLGLSEKEASVYIASIQLGPSPVQKISQKSKVNRATTYVIIESLMQMGLMSTFNEGKKTYYVAEKPSKLENFFVSKQQEIKEKVSNLKEILPELSMLYNDLSDKPAVKYYEGVEGLKSVQNEFADNLGKEDMIYTFLPLDEFEASVLKRQLSNVRKRRIQKKVKVRVIYTSKSGRQIEYERQRKNELQEHFYVDHSKYPLQGGMNIYGDKILMIDYLGKLGGIVIENKTLASMMKNIFEMIWDRREK